MIGSKVNVGLIIYRMKKDKQLRVLHALSTGRYKVVDGRLWIFYQGAWKIKVGSDVNGYRQHILFGGRGWGKVIAYEHQIVWLFHNGVYSGEIDHLNSIRNDNRLENLEPVTKSENGLRCHKVPAHIIKWETFDTLTVMTAVELFMLGWGFTGIARQIKKDRSSVAYQVNNILFGKKKSIYLTEDEVVAYRRMYRKEIEFRSQLRIDSRYEL